MKSMKKQDIKIGEVYYWAGYVVEATGIEADGIVIQSDEVGEEVVKPCKLKEI